MHHSLTINNNAPFSFEAFHQALGMELQLIFTSDFNQATYYYFTQKDSVTLFCLIDNRQGALELCMDALASYSDYRLFPYLADTLHHFVNGGRLMLSSENGDSQTVYECYNEDWIEESIGEEIALLKSVLSVAPRYYLTMPCQEYECVTLPLLQSVGVTLHSSTPRIYGYVQYLLQRSRLPQATEILFQTDGFEFGNKKNFAAAADKITAIDRPGQIIFPVFVVNNTHFPLLQILPAAEHAAIKTSPHCRRQQQNAAIVVNNPQRQIRQQHNNRNKESAEEISRSRCPDFPVHRNQKQKINCRNRRCSQQAPSADTKSNSAQHF